MSSVTTLPSNGRSTRRPARRISSLPGSRENPTISCRSRSSILRGVPRPFRYLAGGYHHHIALNTWRSGGGARPSPGTTGLDHLAILYPDRSTFAAAYRRLVSYDVSITGASDHGGSEAVYLEDPDGNGLELTWDRSRDQWPRTPDGELELIARPLDLEKLAEER
jgi:catechol-2,3-dioxygenase